MENETKVKDMENRLSNLESRLEAALRSADTVDPLGDIQAIRDPIYLAFKRKMWKYAIVAWSFIIFCTVWAVHCFISFGQTAGEDIKGQLFFIALFIVAIMGTVLIKLWYWQVWNYYSTVRDIKRLELRIAELVEKLNAESDT